VHIFQVSVLILTDQGVLKLKQFYLSDAIAAVQPSALKETVDPATEAETQR